MCYDISLHAPTEMILEQVPGIVVDPQLQLDLDTHTHVLAQSFRKCPVVILEDNLSKLKMFEWGVIADYMNTAEKIKDSRTSMCNARSEKLTDKKSVWHRLRNRRCLIPVNGFFEHREIKGWKNKVPYFIHLKDKPLFFLAGLYNYSPIPDVETGEVRGTFTVITKPANSLMKMIHNGGANKHRMPMILSYEDQQKWMDPFLTEEEMVMITEKEFPAEQMEAWPVYSIRTTKTRPDGALIYDRFVYDSLPELGSDDGPQLTLL
ncbi:MAG: SOS response-associated peptidase [Flavitalea sp.]